MAYFFDQNGPKSKAMTPEHQKIHLFEQRVEKKVKQLALQKEILKKAPAGFMSEAFKHIS